MSTTIHNKAVSIQKRVLAAARDAFKHNCTPIPTKADGSKRPDISSWRDIVRLSIDELSTLFAAPRDGFGVLTGKRSGGLEVLDFDTDAARVFQEYTERCDSAGLGEILQRVTSGYMETTPSGGVHLAYRCNELEGNITLSAPRNDKPYIETRGEGGFIVVAPSGGRTHETGEPYVLVRGGFNQIASINPEERRELHRIARTFDEREVQPTRSPRVTTPKSTGREARPGDDFNAKATWAQVLEPHGWVHVYQRGNEGGWRRPGKSRGISATTNHMGTNTIKVFSTSTLFATAGTYSKFGTYAVLNNAGDFVAAARVLSAAGYGNPFATKPRFRRGRRTG